LEEIVVLLLIFSPFIFLAGLWIYFIWPSEKESSQAPNPPLTSEKELVTEEELQTPEPPTLPYSTFGIASCLMSVFFWIVIFIAGMAYEEFRPKKKNFLADPIGYFFEGIFRGFFEPFAEMAKAIVMVSGAGMLAALIFGIIGLMESETDKGSAQLGCVLSSMGLVISLLIGFSK